MGEKKRIQININLRKEGGWPNIILYMIPYLPNSIICRVCIIIHDSDLKWLILELKIIHFKPEEEAYIIANIYKSCNHVKTYLNQSEFHAGFKLFLYTSVLNVVSPSLTSAKASVVSEDLSITGRFLPATTLTFTFPGIFSHYRSERIKKIKVETILK